MSTPRLSLDSTKTGFTTSTTSTTSTLDKDTGAQPLQPQSLPKRAWTAIKKAAMEHHESVNAAHQLYYGQATFSPKPRGK
jgi:hypothetical protein